MPGFRIINNTSEITLGDEWVPATKFNSKDRIVDEKGHKVSSGYQGRQYRIIEKRERTFSCSERFGRGFLGILAVVCTLCFALFSKSVRNLLTKSKENIRFAVLVPTANLPSSTGNIPSQRVSTNHAGTHSTVQSVQLESIIQAAPWEDSVEPNPLPQNWIKHQALQNIIVDYTGHKITIHQGANYFTYNGKVAIGWHGSYNPPHGM